MASQHFKSTSESTMSVTAQMANSSIAAIHHEASCRHIAADGCHRSTRFVCFSNATRTNSKPSSCAFLAAENVFLKLEQGLSVFHTRPSHWQGAKKAFIQHPASLVLVVNQKHMSVVFPSQNHTTIMPSSRGSTGQIRSRQRPTDDSVPVLGENLSDIGEDYKNALHDTVRQGMDDKCRKECRRRQQRIAEFWKKNCPHCHEVGVQEVPEDNLNDTTKFHFQHKKFD
jgi:hypothetical protein